MKKSNQWLFSLIFVCITGSVAWAQPNFTIESVSGNEGDVVAVNITVDNFTNLIGLQLPIRWDASSLNYVSHENLHSSMAGAAFATPPALPEGQFAMSWFDSNNPVTIANGSIFITINFRLVGNAGTSSEVTFLDDPNRLEAIDGDNPTVNIGVNFTPGTTQILNMGGPDLRLILDDRTVEENESFCIPMRVQGFTDVEAIEYNLTWDPSVIQFVEIRNFNLAGLDIGDFNITNTGTGQLRMAWIALSGSGETLPDNTSIFEMCFEAIGAAGASTGLTFSDIITQPESDTTNGSVTIQGGIEGFAFVVGNGTGAIDGQLCTDITVNDFNDINTFQFSLSWDPSLLIFDAITNIHPSIASMTDVNSEVNGQFAILWFLTRSISIPDNEILFTLCFTGTNLECGVAQSVNFSDTPTELVVSTSSGAIPNSEITLVDGSVTPTCGPVITCDPETTMTVPCYGDEGSIFVTVTPPGSYTYTWNGQASQSEDLLNVGAGEYVLIVTDPTTMLSDTKTVNIMEPDSIFIAGSSTDVTGIIDDGTITITEVSGGTGVLNCLWDPDIASDCLGAEDLAAGMYSLTVVDENDCMASETFTINNAEFNFRVTPSDALCHMENGNCGGSIEVEILGGVGSYEYSIDGEIFNGTATDLCAGSYEIEVTDLGLNDTKMETVTLTGPEAIMYEVNKVEPTSATSSDGMVFISDLTGGTGPYDIVWSATTSDTLSNVGSGNYPLMIVDANGCQIQEMVVLDGKDIDECFSGNSVMTPNEDGKNDVLVISCLSGFDNRLQVYNRWGQIIHTQANYDNTWSGQDAQGVPLEDGVYYWVLLVTLQDDSTREIKGYTNLLRNLR